MASKNLLQLAALLGQGAQTVAPPGTAPAVGGRKIQESAGGAVQAELEKEAAEKEEKGWGNIGGMLGALAGTALAPATGGASLALAGGLGAAGGNAIGQYLDTGEVNPFNVINAGAQGAIPHIVNGVDTKLNPPAQTPAPAAPEPVPSGPASARPYSGAPAGASAPKTGPTTPNVPGNGSPASPSPYSKAGFNAKLGSYINGGELLSTLSGGGNGNFGVLGPRRYKYDENGQLVGAQ